MKHIKSHFLYTKSQRNGILLLIILIVVLQIIYFYIDTSSDELIDTTSEEILAFQAEIDSLKIIETEKKKIKIYPFNPNFISDYKGYTLGMSIEEIDRLHKFRSRNSYVNSTKDFQKVTRISDSLLHVISPYFKFPEWTKKKTEKPKYFDSKKNNSGKIISTTDINLATKEDFMTITGVGNVFSGRIIKYRSKLKGFTYNDQLNEVWGLEEKLVKEILRIFKIHTLPEIKKININTAGFKEVLKLPYIDYDLCKKIFDYRDEVAEFQNISELRNIEDFPQNKYDRIVLYLKAE